MAIEKIKIGNGESLKVIAPKINMMFDMVNNFQTQIDNIVVEGSIDPETAQARVESDGTDHPTLKDRLDTQFGEVSSQLAENERFTSIKASRKRKPIMTLIDDDGRNTVLTKLQPIAEQYNIPIACAIPVSKVGAEPGTMTLSELKSLIQYGFEFVSHTYTHVDLSTLTESKIEQECNDSRNWLLSNGFNGDILVYPYGGVNDLVKDVVAKYFKLGINTDPGDSPVNNSPLNSMDVQRVYIDRGVANAQAKIDEIVANGGWMVLGMHSHYADFDPSEVEQVVNYAISQGVDIVNTNEALKYYGNYLESGTGSQLLSEGITIDAQGEAYGGRIGVVRYVPADGRLNNNTPIGEYKNKCISITHVLTSHASGFPEGTAGILETYRMGNDDFSFQRYYVYNTNKIYRRRWDESTGGWTSWTDLTVPIVTRKLITLSVGVVPAQSSIDINISSGSFRKGFNVIATPQTDLPSGIVWNSWVSSEGLGKLRVSNLTGGSIDCGSVDWHFRSIGE